MRLIIQAIAVVQMIQARFVGIPRQIMNVRPIVVYREMQGSYFDP